MDVRYELVRYCFAFVLGMLAVGAYRADPQGYAAKYWRR